MENINQYDSNNKRTGYWEVYYPNGKLYYKGNYINGKVTSYWKWYLYNGKLESKEFYL